MRGDLIIDPRTPPSQLREQVALKVREAIESGDYSPGDLIRLGPMAKRLGVSITPVREGLLLLAEDGWVVQEPNVGFRAARIRREDVLDTFQIYDHVAGELTARATEAIEPDQLAQLVAMAAELSTVAGSGETERAEILNLSFHRTLYELAESPRLIGLLIAAGRFVPRVRWDDIPGWIDLNVDGHEKILKALERRRPEQARKATHRHLAEARDLLIARLDEIRFWAPESGSD